MAGLAEAVWSLRYPGVVFEFGSVGSGFPLRAFPEVGAYDVLTDDWERPRGDGVSFGQDFIGGQTLLMDIDVYGDGMADAHVKRERIARLWRADGVRATPGAVAELWSHTGLLAYGRPRRFTSPLVSQEEGSVVPQCV